MSRAVGGAGGGGSAAPRAAAVVCAAVIAAPWAFGAVEPLWWCSVALGCLLPVAALLLWDALRGGGSGLPRDAEWLALALPLVPLVTLIPLPGGLVTLLSPGYEQLLAPLGGVAEIGVRPLSTVPRETWHAALVAASAAATFWVIARAATAPRAARWITTLLLACGAALALFGLLQRFVDHRSDAIYWVVPLSEVGTPFGPFVNRNHFGGAMCLFAGLAAGQVLHAVATGRGRRAVPTGAVLVLTVVALVATTSRGAILGLGTMAVTIGLFTRNRSRWKLLVGAAATALVVAGVLELLGALDGLRERLFRVYGRWRHRFAVQGDALRVALEFPVFGTGAGTFEEIYPPFQSVKDARRMSNAHSDWAQFAMETGWLGVALVATIVWRLTRHVGGLVFSRSPERWPAAGPLAGAAGVCVHGFFDVNLHIPSNALLMAATLSLAYAASVRATGASADARTEPAGTDPDAEGPAGRAATRT